MEQQSELAFVEEWKLWIEGRFFEWI